MDPITLIVIVVVVGAFFAFKAITVALGGVFCGSFLAGRREAARLKKNAGGRKPTSATDRRAALTPPKPARAAGARTR